MNRLIHSFNFSLYCWTIWLCRLLQSGEPLCIFPSFTSKGNGHFFIPTHVLFNRILQSNWKWEYIFKNTIIFFLTFFMVYYSVTVQFLWLANHCIGFIYILHSAATFWETELHSKNTTAVILMYMCHIQYETIVICNLVSDHIYFCLLAVFFDITHISNNANYTYCYW